MITIKVFLGFDDNDKSDPPTQTKAGIARCSGRVWGSAPFQGGCI